MQANNQEEQARKYTREMNAVHKGFLATAKLINNDKRHHGITINVFTHKLFPKECTDGLIYGTGMTITKKRIPVLSHISELLNCLDGKHPIAHTLIAEPINEGKIIVSSMHRGRINDERLEPMIINMRNITKCNRRILDAGQVLANEVQSTVMRPNFPELKRLFQAYFRMWAQSRTK